ncbi:hypothetical protein SAMN05216297_11713 [Flavobacterium phragmitis]|uniref:Uncharacterized protein n=1 Tax=Flavobacterium phragmitis TaxID=739143 RepID=A0A1I1WSE4_9FLAO|nr:hypothetical protein SAMN05216297_11713 [Flavobacterium phragmitis]
MVSFYNMKPFEGEKSHLYEDWFLILLNTNPYKLKL